MGKRPEDNVKLPANRHIIITTHDPEAADVVLKMRDGALV